MGLLTTIMSMLTITIQQEFISMLFMYASMQSTHKWYKCNVNSIYETCLSCLLFNAYDTFIVCF